MAALTIVPDLDELEHLTACLGARLEHAVAEQFLRQRGEEAFDDGVIPTVADAAHARREAGLRQQPLVGQRGVLHAAVRMMPPVAGAQPTTRRDARSTRTAR